MELSVFKFLLLYPYLVIQYKFYLGIHRAKIIITLRVCWLFIRNIWIFIVDLNCTDLHYILKDFYLKHYVEFM